MTKCKCCALQLETNLCASGLSVHNLDAGSSLVGRQARPVDVVRHDELMQCRVGVGVGQLCADGLVRQLVCPRLVQFLHDQQQVEMRKTYCAS